MELENQVYDRGSVAGAEICQRKLLNEESKDHVLSDHFDIAKFEMTAFSNKTHILTLGIQSRPHSYYHVLLFIV